MIDDRLNPDDIDAIAYRVVELLREQPPSPWHLVDTATAAKMLSVSEAWVRDHAGELGAMRVGESPRGPLRFDVHRLRGAMEERKLDPREAPTARRRPGPRRRVRDVNLLPLPDQT